MDFLKRVFELGGYPASINLNRLNGNKYELIIKPRVLSLDAIADNAKRLGFETSIENEFIIIR